MSKKILFLNSAKLSALSICLLLVIFCTIGMSFTPAEEGENVGNPGDSTYVTGPRRSHGCSNSPDYAKTIAVTLGNGRVYVSTSNTGQSGSSWSGTENGSQSSISWNCGSTSANDTQMKYCWAEAVSGYHFAKWTSKSDGSGSTSTDNPYGFSVTAKSTDSSKPTEGEIYAVFEKNPMYTATFLPATNGTYTYKYGNNSAVTVTSQVDIETDQNFTLTATPNSGYAVYGWYKIVGSEKTYFEYLSNSIPSYALSSNQQIGVDFMAAGTAVFNIKGTSQYFKDLNTAATAAASSSSKVVVPINDGIVPAGNYTIPSGVTLLIPYDVAYTCRKQLKNGYNYETYASSWSAPSVYRTLTLADGAHIIVNGDISVSAVMCWAMGYNGSPCGKYGLLKMNSGSTITLNSGSNLYAWGYIAGEGIITAKSGSNTYEGFQVTGYRGGNATSDMAGNSYKVFPMNQYYIQNIENKIVFQAGALEHLFMGVTSGWGDEGASIDFVGGPTSKNTLFRLQNGATLTKWYDASKDRQKYELAGNAVLDQIVLDIASVSSKDYVLPLTNNMDLDIKSGTTTINYDVAILPDVNIHIYQGATIDIKANVYVYDADEWNPAYAYAKFTNHDKNTQGAVTFSNVVRPITYTTTTKYSRTSVTDANIIVDGTLSMSSGAKLFTTISGANISGTGTVYMASVNNANASTYQAVQSTTGSANTIYRYDAITVTPAKLHNGSQWYSAPYTGDGKACEYLATAGAAANTTITYANGHWGWVGIWKNGDEVLKTVNVCTEKLLEGNGPDLPQPYTDKDYEYICEKWNMDRNENYQEIVYTPNFRDLPIIKFMMGTDHKSVYKKAYEYGSTPSYEAPNCYGENNKYIYEFIGWSETVDGDTLASLPKVTEPATYYAQYREIPNLEVGNTQTSEEQQETQPGEQQSNPEPEERTVNVSLIVDSTTVGDNGSLIVTTDKNNNPVTLETEVITVQDGGSVTIEEDASIKTAEFVLEATLGFIEDNNGENSTVIPNNSSGQVNGGGKVEGRPAEQTAEPTAEPTEPKVYFKLAHKGGFKKRTWYAIAVPWTIYVPHHAEGGITIYKNGEYKPQKLSIDFDVLRYDGAMRALNGNVSDCWTYIDDVKGYDSTMTPGVFYMIYLTEDADAIRFEKKADTKFHFGNEVGTTRAHSDETGDANWNGVANPNTYNATVNSPGVLVGQCYVVDSEGQGSYHSITFADEQLSVGVPVFVQTEATSILVNNPSSTPASAPRRLLEAEQKHDGLVEVQIAPKGLHYSDRVFLQTEDGKEDIYSIGQDVVKAGTSRRMAQMWIDRYDSKLCMNTVSAVDNTATYPLGISIPNAGTFTISVPADKLNGDEVYLTKNGRILWDLSAGEYTATFEKGTTTEYGLLLVRNKAPEATQGVDEINAGADGQGAMKVLLNNQVYIIRGGEMYTITGSKVQ